MSTENAKAPTPATETIDVAAELGGVFRAIKAKAMGESDDEAGGDGGREESTRKKEGRKPKDAPLADDEDEEDEDDRGGRQPKRKPERRAESEPADEDDEDAEEESDDDDGGEDEDEEARPKGRKEPSYVKYRVERAERKARREAEAEFTERLRTVEQQLGDFRDLQDATGMTPREMLAMLRGTAGNDGFAGDVADDGQVPLVVQRLLQRQAQLESQVGELNEAQSDAALKQWMGELRKEFGDDRDTEFEDAVLGRLEARLKKLGINKWDRDDLYEAYAAERAIELPQREKKAKERGRQEALDTVKTKRAMATDRGTDSGDRKGEEPVITPAIKDAYKALGMKKYGVTLADYARDVAKEAKHNRR